MMQPRQVPGGDRLTAGVDEVGRGPLAGPVVAAAVILHPYDPIDGLADSKTLTAARREQLAREIRRRSLAWSTAWADAAEIDSLNILGATMLAMRRAVLRLPVCPTTLRIDGNRLPRLEFYGEFVHGEAVVRGDVLEPAISAASIVAKVARDSVMQHYEGLYPGYGFAQHKGYPTARAPPAARQAGSVPAAPPLVSATCGSGLTPYRGN